MGTTVTNIQLFNNRTIIFKTLNDACEMLYFHILLQELVCVVLRREKVLPLPGIEPWSVHPTA
jgi:hypothetical protein